MSGDFEAVVIGGGPAGAVCALALARGGRRVAVVEKAAFPRRKVCGEFLSGTNWTMLETLGLARAIGEAAGPDVRRVALYAGETIAEAPMPRTGGGWGRALGRDRLDPILLDAARSAGAAVFQPWRVGALDREDAGWAVQVEADAEQQTLRAPVVVAAHGSWEPGKLPTQLAKSHRSDDLLGFKAHFRSGSLAPDLMPLLLFPGGYGGMVWSDGGRLSLSCCIRRDRLEALRRHGGGSAAEAVERHLLRSCRGIRNVLAEAEPEGPWLAAGPIRPGIRAGYADDIFRAGNVAGESHPIIAEGISMAMQGGWMLAGELLRERDWNGAARLRAGQRYEAAWRRQFAGRIRAAALLALLADWPGTGNLVPAFARTFPALLTWGAALSGKTRNIPRVESPFSTVA